MIVLGYVAPLSWAFIKCGRVSFAPNRIFEFAIIITLDQDRQAEFKTYFTHAGRNLARKLIRKNDKSRRT